MKKIFTLCYVINLKPFCALKLITKYQQMKKYINAGIEQLFASFSCVNNLHWLKKNISAYFLTLFLFSSFFTYAQTAGDYKSVASGNWTILSTWQIYNGSIWSTPTAGQGYPGQFAGTGTVSVIGGFSVTLNANIPNSFTQLFVGDNTTPTDILIVGTGTGGSQEITLSLTAIQVNLGGLMSWNKKTTLHTPSNTYLILHSGGLDVSTPCDATKVLIIGSNTYATCSGGTSTYSFAELNSSGGSIKITANSNAPICQTSSLSLSSSSTGNGNTGATYNWSGSGPNGYTYSSTNQNPSNISGLLPGTYTFIATVTDAIYHFTNSQTLIVIVYPTTVGGTVNGGTNICTGNTSGTLTLTGNTGSVIKWQSSTNNFSSNIVDIANTSSTYISNALTVQTSFRAVVASGVCLSTNSSATTITISETSVGGNVNGSKTICNGNSGGTQTLVGQTGTVLNWQSSTNTSTWTDISNSTTSYSTPILNQTFYYRALVQNQVCPAVYSSYSTITVNTTPTITDKTSSICGNTAFIVIPSGVPAGTTYTWSAPVINPANAITGGSAQGIGQPSISQTLTNVLGNHATAIYTVTPSANSCIGSTFSVTVNSDVIPTISTGIIAPTEICISDPNTHFLIYPVTAASNYTWTVPSGWTITSGEGTSSIYISANTAGGTVLLTTSNLCGTSNQVSASSFSMVNTFYLTPNTDIASLVNWNSKRDGSGINPPNFQISGTTFTVDEGNTGYVNSNFTINSATLQIDGVLQPLSTSSIGGNGTITGSGTLQVTRISDFLNQYTVSNKVLTNLTIDYASITGGQTVSSLTYGNLKMSNTSGTNTPSGNLIVNNNLYTTSGGIFDIGNYTLGGSLNFVSNLGTIRFSGQTNGKAFSSGTVEYYGTNQNIASGNYNSLTILGGGIKTLIGTTIVNGILSLNEGIIVSTSTNELNMGLSATVIGGTDLSYVDGPMKYTITSTGQFQKVFPVGKAGRGRIIEMIVEQTDATPTTYTGEYFPDDANSLGWLLPTSGIHHLSMYGYWHIAKSNQAIQPDGSDANLKSVVFIAHYGSAQDNVKDPSKLLVAKSNSKTMTWMNGGIGNYTMNTVTSTPFNGFSDIAIGTSTSDNALPIELLEFKANVRER